ncbi:hypothetical protein [Archaeoglobus neptunius]|uniref:hypothetical protein n=1 Tax=Archaeoglobus neptunius TaxID=2798580 RepID=UPI00192832E8|nr:hypothetical protein [Archaeoglobus neptunius]
MDRKARAMLMLGVLNDAFGDTRNMVYYLQDFVMSHVDWDEIREFGVDEVLDSARDLEKLILEKMERLKEVIESD